MPEINEVRKCADFIRKKLKNKKIININILNSRYKKKAPYENYKKLKNKLPLKLIDVKTKEKMLYLIFDNNLFLVNRLGLVGGWCYLRNDVNKYEYPDTYKYYSKYSNKEKINTYIKTH